MRPSTAALDLATDAAPGAFPAEGASAPAIRLTGITKRFGRLVALADVSVEFRPGEVHAVLGENGAGKSTLMNIIAGVLQPGEGRIEIEGRDAGPLTPERASSLGIAISYQHPAILDDLSVLENLQVALPRSAFAGRPAARVGEEVLARVGLAVPLAARCDALTVAQRQLLEIGRALAERPRVLILDEPTASLDQDATALLFDRVRAAAAGGAAVIYITHRLAELRQIADRVTVLRDGRLAGAGRVDALTDDDLLRMIVGRRLGATFPPKAAAPGPVALDVRDLAVDGAEGVSGITFEARAGEIVGIAGVAGNGQEALVRALAGLRPSRGEVVLGGRALGPQERLARAAYLPSDRHAEGLAATLSIRENAALTSLGTAARAGVVDRRAERARVADAFASLAVKAPGLEAPPSALSGGNQQKVVLARALLARPGLIVADEPTQGVDVGARAEIYRILREVSAAGTPVVVNSSDAAELEGLCDVVLVLSRGRLVETLRGEAVEEARIVATAVGAATQAGEAGGARAGRIQGGWRHWAQLDGAPALPLLLVTLALGAFGTWQNPNFLSSFNIANILILATALGFVALGQTTTLLLGAIDLSVGPLMGLLVVIASFFVVDGVGPGTIALGFLLMAGVAALVGLVNGALIRFAGFTAIAATLALFIGLQGVTFLLRDAPGGYITYDVIGLLTWQVGPVPVAFLAMVATAALAEWTLRRTRFGRALRAVGSNEERARRVGLRPDRVVVAGFVICSLLTALGAVMLMSQIGVGDPREGINYTLASITAVVLGGTSLRGGRGTFLGSALGAVLLTEALSMVTFLGLSTMYQYVFQGGLILASALIYAAARGRAAE